MGEGTQTLKGANQDTRVLVCTGPSFVPPHFPSTNQAGGCRSVPLAAGHKNPTKMTLLVHPLLGCTFGTFFALLVAGIICQSLGWPFVFYIFGE